MATARSCSTSGLRLTTLRSSRLTLQMRRFPSLAPGSEGIDRLADALDPEADALGVRLQLRAVDDEPGADIGDVLDLDQIVGLQRLSAGDQIHDAPAEAKAGRQLHRARQ